MAGSRASILSGDSSIHPSTLLFSGGFLLGQQCGMISWLPVAPGFHPQREGSTPLPTCPTEAPRLLLTGLTQIACPYTDRPLRPSAGIPRLAKPGLFAELRGQRTTQLHVTKGIQGGEGFPPPKKTQPIKQTKKTHNNNNNRRCCQRTGVDGAQAEASDGADFCLGERGRGLFFPRNSLFVEDSFLVRSASSELCLLTWVLSCLQMCHFSALPNPREMEAATFSPPPAPLFLQLFYKSEIFPKTNSFSYSLCSLLTVAREYLDLVLVSL